MISLLLVPVLLGPTQTVDFNELEVFFNNGVLATEAEAEIARYDSDLARAAGIEVLGCSAGATGEEVRAARARATSLRHALLPRVGARPIDTVVRRAEPGRCPHGVELRMRFERRHGVRPDAVVTVSKGDVHAEVDGERQVRLFVQSLIPEGATIVTGPNGFCVVRLPDRSIIQVRRNTRLALDQLSAGGKGSRRQVSMKLFAGRVWAGVAKLFNTSDSWKMDTVTATAGVRGTAFTIGASSDGEPSTDLAVFDGAVGMKIEAETVEVPAGYAITARADGMSPLKKLLAPPLGLKPEVGTFARSTAVSWHSVPGAVSYRLEMAADVEFERVLYAAEFDRLELDLEAPPGSYFWRVRGIDRDGTEGRPSQRFMITFTP